MGTTVFFNGATIPDLSSDSPATHNPGVVAVIEDDRILAIGKDATPAAARATDPQMVDLNGGVLIPTIGDGHAHPTQGGLEQLGPRVREATDTADIVRIVAEWAAAHPEQKWIYGGSYDSTFTPGGLFEAVQLDEAVPERPVVLNAWDYHGIWVNSEALRRAGITAQTPDPALGRIARNPDGSPRGTLHEQGAMDLINNVAPGRPLDERVEAIRLATADLAALGIGWVQDAWVESADLEAYLEASKRELLSIRVNLAQRADPVHWRGQSAAFVEAREQVKALGDGLLTADTVKFFVDGIIENHTAAMKDDYTDQPGDRGLPNWTLDELTAAAIAFDKAGFQLHLHTIGDAANQLALDVIDAVAARNGSRDRRPVLAHVHLLDPADLPRFAQAGVVANFEPLWARNDDVMTELTVPHIGPVRETWQYSIADMIQSGAHVSFGSDWPVTSPDWREGAATAVLRRAPGAEHASEHSWLPEQRIQLRAALAAYTSGVAWQAHSENRRGVLGAGRDADLVWVDRDPRELSADELPGLRVLGCWVAGVQRIQESHG